jgi:hypothetical protein
MTSEIIGYIVIAAAILLGIWKNWKPEWTLWLRSKMPSWKWVWSIVPTAMLLLGGVLLLCGGSVKSCSIDLPILDWKPQQYPDAWLIIVEESSERDPDIAIMLQDWPWRQSLAERDINFRVYDDDQAEAESYKKLDLKLPAAIFILPTGKVVDVSACPKNKKDMEKLIARVTGK